jgi:hypothetical protein
MKSKIRPASWRNVTGSGLSDVRELDGVPDEEHPEVVADQVPVAVLGVELDGEAARVARRLGGVASTDHRREAHGDGGPLARLLEEPGTRVLARRLVANLAGRLEVAEGDGAARVHDALGDALAIEVADLLEEVVVLEGRRTARPDRPLVLVVRDRMALPSRQARGLLLIAHAGSLRSNSPDRRAAWSGRK